MLRERLQNACDHATPEQNLGRVALVADEFQRRIVPLQSPHDLSRYTCLVHALGFTEQHRYVEIATMVGYNLFAGVQFAHWLLEEGHLTEVLAADAAQGSLVFYFAEDGTFKHAGLLRDAGRVESKWGTLGLFEHEMFDVPRSYGDDVRLFHPLPYEAGIELFYDFAEQQGVQFE